jgi:tRNA threonylcarbamoyladenosine biosynthesis protein TsaE
MREAAQQGSTPYPPIESNSPAETKRLGERLAHLLRAGDVLLLQGELGAGKTCLAQGIGRGLRVKEVVKSSSFVLVNEYDGRLHVYHADLFRLGDPDEVADLYLEENARDGLLIVEWPEVALGALPAEHLLVRFELVDDRARRIVLEPHGARYEELAREFAAPAKRKPRVGA